MPALGDGQADSTKRGDWAGRACTSNDERYVSSGERCRIAESGHR
jgi:hypothetical protein